MCYIGAQINMEIYISNFETCCKCGCKRYMCQNPSGACYTLSDCWSADSKPNNGWRRKSAIFHYNPISGSWTSYPFFGSRHCFLLGFWWNDFEKIVVDRPRKVQKVTEGEKCGKFDACIIWPFSWELMMSVEWMSFGACWSGIFLISSLVFSHVFISVQRPAKLFHAVYNYHYAEGC